MAVLVDQTLVCEAARLLAHGAVPSYVDRPVHNAGRLAQLSLLLDAVLLYEKVYVLASELPPDAERLPLRRALVDNDVLSIVDSSACHAAVTQELARFLVATPPLPGSRFHPARDADSVADAVRAALDGTRDRGEAGLVVRRFQEGTEGNLLGDGRRGRYRARIESPELASSTDPMADLGAHLLALAYSGLSGGTVESAAAHLRTFLYWRVAAHLDLPLYPSLQRLPHYHLIANHVRAGVQDAVYGAVAESFRTTVEEVYADDAPMPVYLPPALTLFLDRLRRSGDVTAAVRALRADSAPLRAALARLRAERSAAASLRELHAARRRFVTVLDELRGTGTAGRAATVVDQALDLAPAVTSVLANPLDVSGYSTKLVTAPQDWIRGWWRRRPYRLAFQLRDRLLEVRDYAGLLAEATGAVIDPAEFANLAEDYGGYLDRLRTYGPAQP